MTLLEAMEVIMDMARKSMLDPFADLDFSQQVELKLQMEALEKVQRYIRDELEDGVIL